MGAARKANPLLKKNPPGGVDQLGPYRRPGIASP
jgi:hypothetical protein